MSASFAGWHGPLPRFRADLQILRRIGAGGRPTMHYVRDPVTFETFEFGEEGAFICRLLDGRTGPEAIRRQFEARFGAALAPADLDVFVEQLAHKGMLEGVPSGPPQRTFAEYFDPEVFLPWFNIRLMFGGRVFEALAHHLEWLFSWPVHLLCGAAFFWAIAIYVLHFREIFAGVARNLTFEFFVLLVLTSCLLVQSPRLIIHGIMCRRYGRQVRDIGIAFLYYVLPIVYCDWSDAIWITDKRKRFWGIAAGLYYQAALWAAATIGWFVTLPGTLMNTFWLNVSFSTSLGFFLFNANPLVKMNGYLLLVNAIEVPRLRERALAAFGAWITFRRPTEVFTRRERRWFIIYGLLIFVYATLHLAFIAFLFWDNLTPLYEGRGALASVALILFVMHRPLLDILARTPPVRWLLDPRGGPARWAVRAGIPAALVGALFLPYPYRTGGPFQFLPAQRAVLRAEVEGMVEEIFVREGDRVAVGQPIARLAARAHEKNLASARAQMEAARADLERLIAGARPERIERARADMNTAAVRLEWSRRRALRYDTLLAESIVSRQTHEDAQAQRDYDAALLEEARAALALVGSGARPEAIRAKEAEIAGLQALVDDFAADIARSTLVSPIAGRIVTPRVEELVGTYLEPGQRDVVAEIEDVTTIQAEVAVPEQDLSDVLRGAPVEVVPWGFHETPFLGRVVRIAPAIGTDSGDTSTAILSGAPGSAVLSGAESSAPRVARVITEIPNPDEVLKPDMTGYAKIAAGDRPVWDVLLRPLARWCMVEVWSWIP